MWQNVINNLPTQVERFFMVVGGAVGAFVNWAVGGHCDLFIWLLVFVVADYFTGFVSALIRHELSSSIGFKGFVKKAVIILICLLFHGIDQLTGQDWIGSFVIAAFCINELISILENVERAGFGSILPTSSRNLLFIVKEQHELTIKNREGEAND